MSKNTGMGQKRNGAKAHQGCDAASHSKQCGRPKEVSKGNKKWMGKEKEIYPFEAEILIEDQDD